MPRTSALLKPVLLAWLVAGTLDISDALLFSKLHGVAAGSVLRYIASAVLGRARAAHGETGTELLGLALHYTVALIWTLLYMALAGRLPVVRRHAVTGGVLYGLVVFVVMNYVVIPLSRIARVPHFTTASLINAVLALVFCIGLPIALVDRRFGPA